ncbi:MAG: mannose-6-phosphate isomerase [Hellea sp.]|nr:mannose-6-phosphate isomerase [Hellea sp.]
MTALAAQANRLERWMREAALPFWAGQARDLDGGWYEHLLLDKSPDPDAIRRLRVQARQVYVYALADRLGWWAPAREVAETTFDFMRIKGYREGGKPGFVHLLNPDCTVRDPRRDLYDHAFYLLACANVGQMGDEIALDVLAFIDGKLTSPHGGWLEGIPHSLPRRANPHMHIFEASLASYELSGDQTWLDRAATIYELFKKHIFDPKHHIIREFFTEDWQYAAPPKGDMVEPGHGVEWVWLLGQYQRLSGVDTSIYAEKLYDRAILGGHYFLNDEEDVHGNIRRESRRLWVQTEVVKAHLAQAERGVTGSADMAAATIEGLFQYYLNEDGSWNDQINACGGHMAKTIPVSTFYHVACMAAEAVRVSGL